MIYSLLMSAATNNTIPLPWWSYLLISLAGAVAMKLASQKHPKRDRREEHVDRDGGVEDDDDYDDDDDEEYYAMSRGGVFNAGGRRKSNLRSCLVVLLLAVFALFLVCAIANGLEGKFNKARHKSTSSATLNRAPGE